ncbi:hypothetical protein B0H14DRAFT_2790684 [Mycena olivaceomarginata]|nr:hypothetical protein B0H14DRAFT_2790684 [Mycena olivaceomarginata]
MDHDAPLGPEFHFNWMAYEHECAPDQYTGTFFPNAQHFVVAGGQFKSITNIQHAHPHRPSRFRTIPLGDLDLCNEIQLDDESGVVQRCTSQYSVRRMYSARIHNCNSTMTVALYQGYDAEEQWRQDIARYSWLRHPNFLQLFGATSSSGLHATIFHDELIPAKQMLTKFTHSSMSTVYFWKYLDARQYIFSVAPISLPAFVCTMWMRPSTSRLCIDLTPSDSKPFVLYPSRTIRSAVSLFEPHQDSSMLASISLDHYHECFRYLWRYHNLPLSTHATVRLGAVVSYVRGSHFESLPEIARIPHCAFRDPGWIIWRFKSEASDFILENGWTRVNSCDVAGAQILRILETSHHESKYWLAQAGYVLDYLNITSNYEDYCTSRPYSDPQLTWDLPSATCSYALCGTLQSDAPERFLIPECAAYWSFDPVGDERLTTVEAGRHGFPNIDVVMWVRGKQCDQRVYTGLRQFYRGKGFDPYSQDVARHLGYPLFQISSNTDYPFARVQDIGLTNGKVDNDIPTAEKDLNEPLFQEYASLSKESSTPVISKSKTRDILILPRSSIILSVQFGLILILGVFRLLDC